MNVGVIGSGSIGPDLAYGQNLLVGAWRDIGLGAYVSKGRPDARFERVLAPYARTAALRAAVGSRRFIPISWVVDARLVSLVDGLQKL